MVRIWNNKTTCCLFIKEISYVEMTDREIIMFYTDTKNERMTFELKGKGLNVTELVAFLEKKDKE